jgi:hypothetical protein
MPVSCLVCKDCQVEDLTPTTAAAIVRLERAGHADHAQLVRTGSMTPSAALLAVRKPPKGKGKKPPPPPANDEVDLTRYKGRVWVFLPATLLLTLRGREGDVVIARIGYADGTTSEHVGVLGSEHRCWLIDHAIDIDSAETVVVRLRSRDRE